MCYFAGYVMTVANIFYKQGTTSYPLRWGGDWNGDTELKDHDFLDYPHFELRV